MAQRDIFSVRVGETSMVSPHLKQIVLNGDALGRFPAGTEGGYIKLLLPRDDVEPNLEDLRTVYKRSISIRSIDPEQKKLVLQFALHETSGPAMKWARHVEPGDEISIAGPGPVKMIEPEADWFLLGADMTGLPALAANLERLPEAAIGHAIIEVPSAEDKGSLKAPPGVSIEWVVNASPSPDRSPLADRIRQIEWREGSFSGWFACEFSAMKRLRNYFAGERKLSKDDYYLSSYWKLGSTDEQHKVAKKTEA